MRGLFGFLKSLTISRKKAEPKEPEIKKVRLSDDPGPIEEFVIIDIETTGLDSRSDKIVELAGVKIKKGEIVDSFRSLVNPGVPIPKEAIAIHHITDQMVKYAPRIDAVLPKFLEFIGDLPVGGHNVKFDYDFIQYNAYLLGMNFNNPFFDTLSLCRKAFPNLKSHKLASMVEYLKIDVKNQHRAFDDVLATAKVYFKCWEILKEKGVQPRITEASEDQIAAFDMVKQILSSHNIDCSQICYGISSSHLSINYSMSYPRWFLKIKLSGRMKYIVTELEPDSIKNMVDNFTVEDCPKSINGRSRVLINSAEDIKRLDKLIVECFRRAEREYKNHQELFYSMGKEITFRL